VERQARLSMLDGWRGISILCVLFGHMLPLGPKALQLNATVATGGMAIFFCLSGFLIVSMLLRNDNIASFLVRRIFRIIPPAWLFFVVVLPWYHPRTNAWLANLLFYANIPPTYLDYGNNHFWSLCVEVQFYVAIAAVVLLLGRRGLILVPVVCLSVTILRISYGVPISIFTWLRVDEILAGGSIALIIHHARLGISQTPILAVVPCVLFALLMASCHPDAALLAYARPYFAAASVGVTIIRRPDALQRLLCNPVLAYVAEISYALYVIHPVTYAGWLGQGDTLVRYTKRVVSLVLTFTLAHISTRYFESRFIRFGHRLAERIEARPASGSMQSERTGPT